MKHSCSSRLSEDRQTAFQEKLRSLHPYEIPEIIFIPISNGLPEYLRWVADELRLDRARRFFPNEKDCDAYRVRDCGHRNDFHGKTQPDLERR